jgi:ribonuclease P protein component
MLPKRRRLTATEVKDILARGRSLRAGVLSAKYVTATHPLRVSVVVSKKVAKRAVDRNRARRAVYRALSQVDAKGIAVIFVHTFPSPPLTPAFLKDLVVLVGH